MFSGEDSEFLYPTRIPFEESTVYSEVNIKIPDLAKFPNYQKARPYVVDLEPGDVLYVPHHWWHFVECLTDCLSINTWVELDVGPSSKPFLSQTKLLRLHQSCF